MIILILVISAVLFIGGVYVGARWSEKIKEAFYSIVSK